MCTVYQTHDFLSGRQLRRQKILGSFFSLENAENALGWFFVRSVCVVSKF